MWASLNVDIPAIIWMTEEVICSTTTSNNRSKNNNNNIVVIIEIRIEILQGASLRMGSHHIKVIGTDIEGRDYNNKTLGRALDPRATALG